MAECLPDLRIQGEKSFYFNLHHIQNLETGRQSAILRIQSFINGFTKSFLHKTHISKIHTLGHHVPQMLLEMKNIGRESEQFIEHAVQIVKRDSFKARTQRNKEDKLKVLLELSNAKGRSNPFRILEKRKVCDKCKKKKNNYS